MNENVFFFPNVRHLAVLLVDIFDITVYLQVENTMKTARFINNMNMYTWKRRKIKSVASPSKTQLVTFYETLVISNCDYKTDFTRKGSVIAFFPDVIASSPNSSQRNAVSVNDDISRMNHAIKKYNVTLTQTHTSS